MLHIAGKSLALEDLSLLKSLMVICSWNASKSVRCYHLKLHFRIQEQGSLTIRKNIRQTHPLTIVSSCILVAEETSSADLMAGLDLECLCNSLFKSISYKRWVWAEHGLCQCQHKLKQSFTIFICNTQILQAPQNHRNLYRSFLSPVYLIT